MLFTLFGGSACAVYGDGEELMVINSREMALSFAQSLIGEYEEVKVVEDGVTVFHHRG